MKFYENGTVFGANNKQIGTHSEDLDGLMQLTDERGTYAPFHVDNAPSTYISFEAIDAAKALLTGIGCMVLGPITEADLQKSAEHEMTALMPHETSYILDCLKQGGEIPRQVVINHYVELAIFDRI